MLQLKRICTYLEQFAPPMLAEDWDNVGLLAGDEESPVQRLMTCLTITPQSADEAIRRRADLIVTHHPLPFRALKRLATNTTTGRLLWDLITHHVAIYSPHTAFDSTVNGINQQLAEGLSLTRIAPLSPIDGAPDGAGSGRMGHLPQATPLRDVARQLRNFLDVESLQYVGSLDAGIEQVAVACGAAGEFLSVASQAGCDLLVLGETNLHTYLEAEANGVALLLPGHFASERFAIERLATLLTTEFPGLEVWASETESDPLRLFGP